ncbi:MAG: glycosyltransferase family 4 protein [Candidatus Marinimicrobia bacterium]|nr:glycosyltransferase family 4 protein [Candidatus Neomarinimicrobiota bacterium]
MRLPINSKARQPKVMQIITRLDQGGSTDVTLKLSAGLVKNGYEVLLVSGKTTEPSLDLADYTRKNGFRLYFLRALSREPSFFFDILAFIQIYRLILKFRPDILHTNTSKAGFLGRFAGRLAKVPKILHSPHGHIFYGYYNRLISKCFIILEKFATHCCDRVLNLTEIGRRDHIRERIGPPWKFYVTSGGVDLAQFFNVSSLESKTKTPDEIIRICWVGRIVPVKNLPMLLNTAAILKNNPLNLEYLIVGDGSDRSYNEKLADELGLSGIQFLGYRSDIPQIMASSDIFVFTSLNEGFGNVIIEAMACGLPIIGTRVGGTPELVQDGRNGLLVKSDNSEALANAIQMIASDPELRRDMALLNRKKAEYFTIDNYIKRVIYAYNTCKTNELA